MHKEKNGSKYGELSFAFIRTVWDRFIEDLRYIIDGRKGLSAMMENRPDYIEVSRTPHNAVVKNEN